ncbi:uncharacterized protein LOC121783187 isoform X2 [Salvia splendens]|nr:uncharacterized protein LOC121783187 isoform X2 [Salvia splendens]
MASSLKNPLQKWLLRRRRRPKHLSRYLQKIEQLRKGGYDGPLGIGLQGHVETKVPNFPYIRAAIAIFHTTTYFDVRIWPSANAISIGIVAQKKHHSKIFRPNSPHNVPLGTVIDNGICHPINNDFYMCALATMM